MPCVVIIGAGGIAQRHVECLKNIEGMAVAGVCDTATAKAESLAAKAHARAFTDAATAIDACRPDYVAVLTPRGVREPMVRLCAERGVPVVVEKPPCDRLSVGHRIEAVLREAKLVHTVGFMHRWHEALNAVLRETRDERLSLIGIRFIAPFATAPVFDRYPDPYQVSRSGGLVGDQGIHYIDLSRYVAGSEVDRIQATGLTRLLPRSESVTTCDTACWTLKMKNGVLVSHSHTWCGPGWDCRLTLVTDRSQVDIDLFGNRASGRLKGRDYRFDGTVNEFELEHRGFLDAVSAGDMSRVRSPYADALESFRVAAEINRAIYGDSAELD